jgi:hypothetical protein
MDKGNLLEINKSKLEVLESVVLLLCCSFLPYTDRL